VAACLSRLSLCGPVIDWRWLGYPPPATLTCIRPVSKMDGWIICLHFIMHFGENVVFFFLSRKHRRTPSTHRRTVDQNFQSKNSGSSLPTDSLLTKQRLQISLLCWPLGSVCPCWAYLLPYSSDFQPSVSPALGYYFLCPFVWLALEPPDRFTEIHHPTTQKKQSWEMPEVFCTFVWKQMP